MLAMVLPSPFCPKHLAALATIARPRVSRAGRRRAPAGAAGRACTVISIFVGSVVARDAAQSSSIPLSGRDPPTPQRRLAAVELSVQHLLCAKARPCAPRALLARDREHNHRLENSLAPCPGSGAAFPLATLQAICTPV